MAERVIDLFESVKVKKHRRDGRALSVCPDQRLFETVKHQAAVRQPREAVVQRLVADLIDEPSVADGHGGLAGESAQRFCKIGIAAETLRTAGDQH